MTRIRVHILAVVFLLLLASPGSAFDPLATYHQYDYVILVHDSLLSEAQRLCAHRAESLRSCVVLTSEVTAAFDGATDVEKIRAFVLYAYEQWKIAPTYLLLVGDMNMVDAPSSEMIDVPSGNLLPAKLIYNDFASWQGNRWFPDDGWYVAPPDTFGKKPIMRVGRLAVTDSGQLANVVDKIIYYEGIAGTPAWLDRILMLVGDANINTNNEIYRTLNDQLFDEEFSAWSPTPATLYSRDYQVAGEWPEGATAATRAAFNYGYGYVNAFGNTESENNLVLMAQFFPSGEPTFTQSLSGSNYLPVVFAGSCLPCYYYRSQSAVSICDDLLTSTNDRGAIALVAASHVNDIIESKQLNGAFAHMMLHDGVRDMGQLFSGSVGSCLEEDAGHEQMLRQYMLMGDPALQLRVPSVPPMRELRQGMEIGDAAVLQDHVSEKTGGISAENTRIAHAENDVMPVSPDRMLRVEATDSPGGADCIEWTLLSGLDLEIEENMVLSYWINIVESPGGDDRLAIDGSTSMGRIKDNPDITDQYGFSLDAQSRPQLGSGWQLIYADLSPLTGAELQDIRLRYETTDISASGALLAYVDNIRVTPVPSSPPSVIMNYSFEDDANADGTPDYWTNKVGEITTPNVVRRDDLPTIDGDAYMQVFDQWCNGEGAQYILHVNTDPQVCCLAFYHYAPVATSFTVTAVDAQTGTELLSEWVASSSVWSSHEVAFDVPGSGVGPRRVKLRFTPDDCARAVYVDKVMATEEYRIGVSASPMGDAEYGRARLLSTSPNPAAEATECRLAFFLPVASQVRVRLYDVCGREVAASPIRRFPPGVSHIDLGSIPSKHGLGTASGVYLASLEVNGRMVPGGRKITLVR